MKCDAKFWATDWRRLLACLGDSVALRVLFTVMIAVICGFILSLFLTPDGLSPQQTERIQQEFILPASFFVPEPTERGLYLMTLVLLPSVSLLLSLVAWGRGRRNPESSSADCGIRHLHSWYALTFFFIIFLILLALFARENPFGEEFGLGDYVLVQIIVRSGLIWLFIAMVAWLLVVAYATLYQVPVSICRSFSSRLAFRLADLAAVLSILYIAGRISFRPETVGADAYDPSLIHISPLFEPAVAAYLGHSTAAVNMVSQYGGLVEFARPFLILASGDPLGLFWFAFFALAASMLFFWLTVRQLLSGNATAAFILTMGLIYLTEVKLQSFVCFQCTSFRWFWPSVFLFLAAHDLFRRPGWRQVPFFLMPFAIYWNPETGLACTAAWVGWRLIVVLLSTARLGVSTLQATLLVRGVVSVTLSCCFGALILTAYFISKANAVLDVSLLFQYARDFYELGFYMIPMPGFHLWNLFVLMAVALYSIGLDSYLKPRNDNPDRNAPWHGFIIFSTLLFGFLFSYYQGRSFYSNLLVVSYPLWLAAIAWLGTPQPDSGQFISVAGLDARPLKILLLAVFCASALSMTITTFQLPPIQIPFGRQDLEGKKAIAAFIDQNSDGKQPVFISFSSWRLALLSKHPPPPEVVPLAALFRRAQESSFFRVLCDPNVVVYYDRATARIFRGLKSELGERLLAKLRHNFLMNDVPVEDMFSGSQGSLMRLRPHCSGLSAVE